MYFFRFWPTHASFVDNACPTSFAVSPDVAATDEDGQGAFSDAADELP